MKQAAEDSGDHSFSRYTVCSALMDLTDVNSAMFSGLYSTQYYWSLSNGNISQFLLEQENGSTAPTVTAAWTTGPPCWSWPAWAITPSR